MENTSFKFWLAQEVEKVFGVRRVKHSPVLDRWLEARPPITQYQRVSVERLRLSAEDSIDAWNEEALKFFFIGPLCSLIDFNTENYRGFLERTLTIKKGKHEARGNVDFMVATGRQTPEAPFYVLHEYKREMAKAYDPQGQLLIAMLSAHFENQDKELVQPVYGSYVLGRFWFFVVLNGGTYTISRAFDCTREEGIEAIFSALLQVRLYIEDLAKEFSGET